MKNSPVFIIIGASTAGAFAAFTLRKEGFDGRIILLGAEKELPYARPPLSKQYLQGKYARDRLFLWDRKTYEEQGIEVLLGMRATRVVPAEKQVELANGQKLPADRLLIATGMTPRKLPLPGADFPNVHYLRTLQDCEAILHSCEEGGRAVIIGGGFIGMEVAATLAQRDMEVTVIHQEAVALEHALGRAAANILMDTHRQQGIVFHSKTRVSSIQGKAQAEMVKLESGVEVPCTTVIIGAGVMPALDVVKRTNIRMNSGIIVNEHCETSMKNVFAAGDVTEFYHPALQKHIHVEHWENARLHGMAAARNMLGRRYTFKPIPFFWSDQFMDIQYVGFPLPWEETVLRGKIEDEEFSVFMLDGGRLVAAVCFNRWKERRACERILDEGIVLGRRDLADEKFDLGGLGAQVAENKK